MTDETERAMAAKHDTDDSTTLPAALPSIRASVTPEGNIDLEYDDGVTVFQIFGIAALLTRLGNTMLDTEAIGKAQAEATRRALAAPRDHRRKSN